MCVRERKKEKDGVCMLMFFREQSNSHNEDTTESFCLEVTGKSIMTVIEKIILGLVNIYNRSNKVDTIDHIQILYKITDCISSV